MVESRFKAVVLVGIPCYESLAGHQKGRAFEIVEATLSLLCVGWCTVLKYIYDFTMSSREFYERVHSIGAGGAWAF